MLFQIGPLTLDTDPIEVGGANFKVSADFAKHDLVGRRRALEFVGAGDDPIELTGTLLPFHIGGLTEIDIAKQLCSSGEPQYVMRGDGWVAGWYQLMSVEDNHDTIAPNGVGFVVKYKLSLEKVDDPGDDVGGDLISNLLDLFG